jgi:hypothetical protein
LIAAQRENATEGYDAGMDAFRDDLSAAIERAERLARENDELRSELQRRRAQDPVEPPPRPPDAMTRNTLERLERLSEEIDVHAEPMAVAAPPSLPEARLESAPDARLQPNVDLVRAEIEEARRSPLAEARIQILEQAERVRRRTLAQVAVVAFALGAAAGYVFARGG